jgi:hypothetical protein
MAIYLFSVKTFVFVFFYCSSFDKKGGVGLFFIIGVPLLHLIPPKVNAFSQNTNYIQGHLSMQDSAAAYASTYLNLRNGN